MKGIPQAAVSVALSGLLAVCAYAGTAFLAAGVGLGVVLVVLGWGRLMALPSPRGSAAVIAASGAAGIVAALVARDALEPLTPFASVLALSVLLAFAHELLRRDGRPRLLESVSGTVMGQMVVVLGAAWILLPLSEPGVGTVAVAACAAVAARLATALPWPLRITGWLAILAGASVSGVVEVLISDRSLGEGAIVGATVAVVVASFDRTLSHQPAASSPPGAFAAAAAPVLAAGTGAYVIARIVLG